MIAFPPADGLTWFAAGAGALKFPPLVCSALFACSVTDPSGLASPVEARPVDVRFVEARPAFSKTLGFSRLGAGDKAWLTRLVSSAISLVCSSTCACVAFGSSKTALAAARRASTLSWSSCIELGVSFANKAFRVPWSDLASVVLVADVGCSCSFTSPAWANSGWVDSALTSAGLAVAGLAPSAGASFVFTSSAGLGSAGWSVRAFLGSPSSEGSGFPSALPSGPAVATLLAVAEDIAGAWAATPLAKNINAATATLAAPKWYFLIE